MKLYFPDLAKFAKISQNRCDHFGPVRLLSSQQTANPERDFFVNTGIYCALPQRDPGSALGALTGPDPPFRCFSNLLGSSRTSLGCLCGTGPF